MFMNMTIGTYIYNFIIIFDVSHNLALAFKSQNSRKSCKFYKGTRQYATRPKSDIIWSLTLQLLSTTIARLTQNLNCS